MDSESGLSYLGRVGSKKLRKRVKKRREVLGLRV